MVRTCGVMVVRPLWRAWGRALVTGQRRPLTGWVTCRAASTSAVSHSQDEPYTMTFLKEPDGLAKRGQRAAQVCKQCLALLGSGQVQSARQILRVLDTMSNELCLVLDAAEFVRNLHPDERYADSALQAFLELNHYMNVLNTDRTLFDHVLKILEHRDTLTPEEIRCAEVFKHDMLNNGIRLPDAQRDGIANVRSQIEELCSSLLATKHPQGRQQRAQTLGAIRQQRHHLATILQEPSFAHNTLSSTLAGSPEQVWAFLSSLTGHLLPLAQAEMRLL
eukprot:RCo050585